VASAAVFLALVGLAGWLRFWGIDQSLPLVTGRPDEREILQYTAGFPAGDLNPRWFIYPNLYFYVVFAWERLVLAVRGLWLSTSDYGLTLRTALPSLILYGRWLSALAGTLTVPAVWVIGRRLGGEGLGLAAAALLATDFLHVRDSHTLKPDTLLALGLLISVWLLARWRERPGRGGAIAAGVAIGLTTGIKYPGILLLVPAWVADPRAGRRGIGRLLPSVELLALVAAAALTIVLTNPYLVLDLGRTRDTATFSTRAVYATRPEATPAAGAGALARAVTFVRTRAFGYHLGVSLRHGAGLAVALATPLALLVALRRPRRPFLVLASVFTVFYYLVAGTSPVHLARYLTPLVPLLALLVAELARVAVAPLRSPALRGALFAGLVAALAAEPLASCVAYDRIASRTDTRVLATRWMTDHLPPGAAIAVLGSVYFPIADPDVPPGARRIALPLGATDLARRGVGYVVTHEHHQIPFSRLIPRQIEALRPHLHLLAEFSPYRDGPAGVFEDEDAYYVPFYGFAGVVRPGPVVRVYAYDTSPDGGAGLHDFDGVERPGPLVRNYAYWRAP